MRVGMRACLRTLTFVYAHICVCSHVCIGGMRVVVDAFVRACVRVRVCECVCGVYKYVHHTYLRNHTHTLHTPLQRGSVNYRSLYCCSVLQCVALIDLVIETTGASSGHRILQNRL